MMGPPDRELDTHFANIERMMLQIEPVLTRQPAEDIGACLAHLLAKFLAGHHPDIRGDIYHQHMKCVRGMIPQCEEDILKPYGGKWPQAQ